jgi:ribosomal protein S18 acetylase RimI-like enzyme
VSETIRTLDPSLVPDAARALAAAFQEDPVSVCMQPDPDQRARVLPWFFAGQLRYGLRFGEVHAAPDGSGVAIWHRPGAPEMSGREMVDAGLLESLDPGEAARQAQANQRGAPLFDRIGELYRRYLPEAHWYLAFLGVDPATQGRGVGGRILRPMLERLGAESQASSLWTGQPRNVAFYEKQGFRVLCTETEPTTRLSFWIFNRQGNA